MAFNITIFNAVAGGVLALEGIVMAVLIPEDPTSALIVASGGIIIMFAAGYLYYDDNK